MFTVAVYLMQLFSSKSFPGGVLTSASSLRVQMCRLQPAACRRQIVEGGSDETVLICRALGPNVAHLYSPGCNNTLICTEIRGKVFIDSRYTEPRPTDGTEPKYD